MQPQTLLCLMVIVVGSFLPAAAFDSTLKYGCQSTKCSFQLVVPKEVAQYINEQDLKNQVSQISSNLVALGATINGLSATASTDDFTTKFNEQYAGTNQYAIESQQNANSAAQNSDALLADASTANSTSVLLYNAISCFKGDSFSYTCFSRPTTVAPPTTTGAPTTTAAGGVTGGSTVTAGTSGTAGTQPTGATGATGATGTAGTSGTSGTVPTGGTVITGAPSTGSTGTPGTTVTAGASSTAGAATTTEH